MPDYQVVWTKIQLIWYTGCVQCNMLLLLKYVNNCMGGTLEFSQSQACLRQMQKLADSQSNVTPPLILLNYANNLPVQCWAKILYYQIQWFQPYNGLYVWDSGSWSITLMILMRLNHPLKFCCVVETVCVAKSQKPKLWWLLILFLWGKLGRGKVWMSINPLSQFQSW